MRTGAGSVVVDYADRASHSCLTVNVSDAFIVVVIDSNTLDILTTGLLDHWSLASTYTCAVDIGG